MVLVAANGNDECKRTSECPGVDPCVSRLCLFHIIATYSLPHSSIFPHRCFCSYKRSNMKYAFLGTEHLLFSSQYNQILLNGVARKWGKTERTLLIGLLFITGNGMQRWAACLASGLPLTRLLNRRFGPDLYGFPSLSILKLLCAKHSISLIPPSQHDL